MCQVEVLVLQTLVVGVAQFLFEQSCLTEEEGFELEKVVAMLVKRTQGD